MIICLCNMKQNYELNYIVSGQLPEETVSKISQKINGFIEQKQGLITDSQLAQKITLAYKIKGETMAWLQNTSFSIETSGLPELEKELRETKEIMRFLALRKDSQKPMVIRRRRVKPKTAETTTAKPEAASKADLEEIEKKLEEILK